jgi:HK97 family phage major capsid protein
MAVADIKNPTPQTAATKTGDFTGFLKPEMSAPIFEMARKSSSIMQLARRIPMGQNGVEIPFSTYKATAAWVAEAGQKPTTESGLSLKSVKPHKIAAISVVSAEVVRANPGSYLEILRADLAEAVAVAFDKAALHGTNSPFGSGNNIDATTKSVALGTAAAAKGSVYGDVVAGLDALAKADKKLTGFLFDRQVEPLFLGSVDTAGRPLFVDAPPLSSTTQVVTGGSLIGRPSYLGDNVKYTPTAPGSKAVLGYGGDFAGQCVWGSVGGLSYKVSTEATVTIGGNLVSLFESNLVAILMEAEFAFLCNDPESFVKFTAA